MRGVSALPAVLSLALVSLAGGTAFAQTSTMTETKPFEVVWVQGNKVIVRGAQGAQEYTVPDDFRFNVDGRQVSVRELRPGMRGTATITTTTTVTPVTVTEVHNGEVMRVTGNSIIVRGDNGIQMFSEGDADRRNAQIIRNGRPAAFRDLRRGDRLTATVVTEKPPEVMTERQVEATLDAPPERPRRTGRAVVMRGRARPVESGGAAAATETSTPAAAETATPARGAGSSSARSLPKTASPLPLVGLVSVASIAVAMFLNARRRWRAKHSGPAPADNV